MKAIVLIVLAFGIVACGTATVSELRSDSTAGSFKFTVPQPYQMVFRTIIESEHLPMHESKWGLYPDLGRGAIWVQRATSPFDKFAVIDVIRLNESVTKVTYTYIQTWEQLGYKIKSLFPDTKVE